MVVILPNLAQAVPLPQDKAPAPNVPTPSIGPNVQPQTAPAVPPTTPQASQKLEKDWLDYLKTPEVIAGMLQFGIDVGQPIAPAQSTLGHITGSIAGGGEAMDRVVKHREGREDKLKEQSQKDRDLELEDLRRKAEAKAEKDKITVRREEITAKREIAKEGIDAHMTRLDKQISAKINLARDTRERELMTKIMEDATEKYKACQTSYVAGVSTPCVPPTTTGLMSRFRIINSAVNNKGIVPDDGTVPDSEIIDQLVSGTPAQQAQANSFLGFLSPEAQARITAEVSKQRGEAAEKALATSRKNADALKNQQQEPEYVTEEPPLEEKPEISMSPSALTPEEAGKRAKTDEAATKALRAKTDAEIINLIKADIARGTGFRGGDDIVAIISRWSTKLGNPKRASRLVQAARKK